jgi:hypothetical protein
VTARLKRPDGSEETFDSAYLAGCDGAHSRVRESSNVGFPGGTYSHFFYVADVEATGPVMNGELHVALDDAEFLGIFPLLGGHTGRLIGTVREDDEEKRKKLRFEDVGEHVASRMGVHVEKVNWFSTYRVHHRVAGHFRNGRVFLCGDAGHVHSPVGGQGMNTGIGDAVNLAWKLADVVRGRARESLLDSYEPERIAFARRLVATTDRAFAVVTSDGSLARLVRTRVAPRILPILIRFAAFRRLLFLTVSQTAIHYRMSPLSAGAEGRVRGGDRLPWVDLGPGSAPKDNYEELDGLRWQVNVYGEATPELAEACRHLELPLRIFAWTEAMRVAGLARNALYLLRPDGYVALADPAASSLALRKYLDRVRASRP